MTRVKAMEKTEYGQLVNDVSKQLFDAICREEVSQENVEDRSWFSDFLVSNGHDVNVADDIFRDVQITLTTMFAL